MSRSTCKKHHNKTLPENSNTCDFFRNTANQRVGENFTNVTFQEQLIQNNFILDVNDTIICKKTGTYAVDVNLSLYANADTDLFALTAKNGNIGNRIPGSTILYGISTSNATLSTASNFAVEIVEGDEIAVFITSNNGTGSIRDLGTSIRFIRC